MAKAAAAGETPKETCSSSQRPKTSDLGGRHSHTKSAKESSSCPIKLLFFLHLATFPSIKSKNNPNGIKASAAHRFACAEEGPRQYRIEEKIDMTPQNPIYIHQRPLTRQLKVPGIIPLSSVMRSARCSILIIEKCPESSVSNFFCLSVPTHHQHHTLQNLGRSCSIPGTPTVESFVAPFTALLLVLFDIVGLVLIVHLAQYDSQIWNVDVG